MAGNADVPLAQNCTGQGVKHVLTQITVLLRCGVIGNSGILLKQRSGRTIDKFDAILRYNNAPTQGFEQCVCIDFP